MLEMASNLRISLDLFELAIGLEFGTNYGLQLADKSITGWKKVALRYFGQFPAKRRLDMIDTLVFFIENLTLQNAPGKKVHLIEIRSFWWPLYNRMNEPPF